MSMLLISAAVLLAAYAIFLVGFNEGRRLLDRKHIGELLVIDALERSSPKPFHLLNNVTLRSTKLVGGTTQIDHILITLEGIFVIETKHYSGRILIDPGAPEWRQVFPRKEVRIRNPIFQNYGHVEELRRLLNLGSNALVNLVVFSGRAQLSPSLNPNVISLVDVPGYFSIPRPAILSERALYDIIGRIEVNRLPRSDETDEYHVQSIKHRLRNTPSTSRLQGRLSQIPSR